MKSLVYTALLFIAAGPAVAHQGALSVEGCHDDVLLGSHHCHGAQPIIIAGAIDAPLSSAAVETRNPLAPQSNFTAKTIADDAVFAAQVVLHKNGCYDGRLDGVLGPGTVYAVKLFEAHMGLAVTGELDEPTASALRASHTRFDICR